MPDNMADGVSQLAATFVVLVDEVGRLAITPVYQLCYFAKSVPHLGEKSGKDWNPKSPWSLGLSPDATST